MDSGYIAQSTASETITVHIAGVADAPTLITPAASGNEGSPIALTFSAVAGNGDGSEAVSGYTITGVPTGAVLNHGTENGDGSWTLAPSDLAGLTVTPAPYSNADFTLQVTAIDSENGGNVAVATATATSSLVVSVAAEAYAPILSQGTAASGAENTLIPLHLTTALTDPNEALSLSVSGVPSGAHFYADAAGNEPIGSYNSTTGTWTFSSADIAEASASGAGYYLRPPANWSDYDSAGHNSGITLSAVLTSTNQDVDGGALLTAHTSGSYTVHVGGVADVPLVTATAVSGNEDGAITLNIAASLPNSDGSEAISAITIAGVPSGAVLNHGTENNDGSWTLSAADLNGLTITPPLHSTSDFTLQVSATASEQGSVIAAGGATATSGPISFTVEVDPVAHTPILTQSALPSGTENAIINLNLTESLAATVNNETLGMTVTGVPSGAHFYADGVGSQAIGTENGDGSWTFSAGDITAMQTGGHGLFLQPPTGWSDYDSSGHAAGMTLSATLTSTSSDHDSSSTSTVGVTDSFTVHVAGIAEAPSLATGDDIVALGDSAQLQIQSATAQTDGSEVLSLTVSGIPSGATLSHGTENSDGSWTVSPSDASNLTVSGLSAGIFTLQVTATSSEADGSHASTTSNVTLDVLGANSTQGVASLSSTGQLLTFDHLPPAPANGDVLGEFVFGSNSGIHAVSVYGIDAAATSPLEFDINGVVHTIAAGTHGTIDSAGLHVTEANGTIQTDTTAAIDSGHSTVNITVNHDAVIHLQGLHEIVF